MQNKHNCFPFWESQNSGRGGQAGWDKIQTFTENFFEGFPLREAEALNIISKWFKQKMSVFGDLDFLNAKKEEKAVSEAFDVER